MVQIDSNIPIPETTPKLEANPKYPWHQLEVGQSFACKWPYYVANANRTILNKKFIVRKTNENSTFRWRVWRTV